MQIRPWPTLVLVLTATALGLTVGVTVLGVKLKDTSQCVSYPATNAMSSEILVLDGSDNTINVEPSAVMSEAEKAKVVAGKAEKAKYKQYMKCMSQTQVSCCLLLNNSRYKYTRCMTKKKSHCCMGSVQNSITFGA